LLQQQKKILVVPNFVAVTKPFFSVCLLLELPVSLVCHDGIPIF